MFGFLKHVI